MVNLIDAWIHDDPAPADAQTAEQAETDLRDALDTGDPDAIAAATQRLENLRFDAFWDARPIHRHLHDFARARRVAPTAVLGVTLARVVVATPYTIGLPPIVGGPASLNLFIGLVGDSGSGKGAAAAVSAEAVKVGYIETHTLGSGEGIAHGYMRRVKNAVEWLDEHHAVLFDVPEIDALTALGDRRGATLVPQLRQAWSGERLGFGYADPTKRLMVPGHQYRMALVAGIQPLRAEALLADTAGGTPQRFVWLPATDPDAPDTPPDCPDPIHWTLPHRPGGLILEPGASSSTWPMPVCDTARTVIDRARLARLRHQAEALDGHALLARLKVAAALALLDGHLEVTDEDWRLAGTLSEISTSTRRRVQATIQRHHLATGRARAEADGDRAVIINDRVTQAAAQRISATLRRHLAKLPAGEWMPRGELRRRLPSRDRPDFEDALDRLIDAGQVETDNADRDTEGHGGPGTRIRLKETR